MLCSAGPIVADLWTNPCSERRANVPHQLEFWAAEQNPPPTGLIWMDLDAEERTAAIGLLARMITRAVHPQRVPEIEENEDER